MKVFDPSFQASQSAMCAMLKKANLESRGFQKEIITKSVMKPGKDGADFVARIKHSYFIILPKVETSIFLPNLPVLCGSPSVYTIILFYYFCRQCTFITSW